MKSALFFLMAFCCSFGRAVAQETPPSEKLHTLKEKVDLGDVAKKWEDRGFAGPEVPSSLWFAISKLAQETAVLSVRTNHEPRLSNQNARTQMMAQVSAELQAQLVTGLPDRLSIQLKLARVEEDFRNFSLNLAHHHHWSQPLSRSVVELSAALSAARLELEKLQ